MSGLGPHTIIVFILRNSREKKEGIYALFWRQDQSTSDYVSDLLTQEARAARFHMLIINSGALRQGLGSARKHPNRERGGTSVKT